MTKKTLWDIRTMTLCLLIVGLFVTACAQHPTGAVTAQQQPVRIGAVLSLTGYAAQFGQESQRGINLAVDEINYDGGINGRPLAVVYEDDATSGATAVSATRKLIAQDVDVLIGGTWDLSLEPMVPLAEEHHLVLVNPSTGNTQPTGRRSALLFCTWPPIHRHVATFEHVIRERDIHAVAVIRNSGSWALAHRDALDALLAENDGSIVLDESGPLVDNNDFRTSIVKIHASHVDAVFLALGHNDAAHVVRMLRNQGFDGVVLSADGAIDSAIRAELLMPSELRDAYYLSMVPVDESFVAKYRARYTTTPGVSADTAYDAVHALAKAMRAANNTQTDEIVAQLNRDAMFNEYGDSTRVVPLMHANDGVVTRVS